jgi:uncharacterized protein (TIGR01244 family)
MLIASRRPAEDRHIRHARCLSTGVSRFTRRWIGLGIALLTLGGCRSHYTPDMLSEDRPAKYAQPLVIGGLDIPIYRVTDMLYRGPQLNPVAFAELKKMGIKTVINLRATKDNKDEAHAAGLDYVHIRFTPWLTRDEQVVEFLKVATDPARQPVLVYCHYGADRTGLMTAMYRIIVQGWSREEAHREMVDGGYGFVFCWWNMVNYVRDADLDKIAREAGLERAPASTGRREPGGPR